MRFLNVKTGLCLIVISLCAILAGTSCSSKKSVAYEDDWQISKVQKNREEKEKNKHKGGNKNLYKEVDSWLGTPYKYGGNTKSGTDCSGFVVSVYSKVYGKKLYRSSYQIYDNNCEPIKKRDLREGDLVFFASKKGRRIDHVGIYLKNNKFAHATNSRGVIISDLDERYWANSFVAAGRVER